MAFENINWGMLPQAELNQQQSLLQSIGQGIANYQEGKRRAIELEQLRQKQSMPDFEAGAQIALYKQAMGMPVTKEDIANVRVMAQTKADQSYIDPYTQKMVVRQNPYKSAYSNLLGYGEQDIVEESLPLQETGVSPQLPYSGGGYVDDIGLAPLDEAGLVNALGEKRSDVQARNLDVSNVKPKLGVNGFPISADQVSERPVQDETVPLPSGLSGTPAGEKMLYEQRMANKQSQQKIIEKEAELKFQENKELKEKKLGQSRLDQTLQKMIDDLNEIEKLGGGVSSEKGVFENIKEYAKTTGVGKEISKAIGTKQQAILGKIESSKKLLLPQIMQATGMSSKSLDSNTEYKAYTEALNDPSLDIQSQKENLQRISQMFGGGTIKINESKKNTVDDGVTREKKLKRLQELRAKAGQ